MNKDLLFQISDENFLNEKSGKFYLGIDPTGAGLHIGHLIPIKLALTLLERGFDGVILIGGFTGQIGDPTDKNEARKKLEAEDTQKFTQGILGDIYRIFSPYKNQIVYRNNKDWLDSMSLSSYLSLAYNISIVRKLHLDTFDKRIKQNLSLSAAEFLYPDIQMIDFLHLCTQENCNIQIGGADQWGNISYGVHYVKKITRREDIFGLCTPLLTSNNKKISKSEGNPALASDPAALYQFCIRSNEDVFIQMCNLFDPSILTRDSDHQSRRKSLVREVLRLCYPVDSDRIFTKIDAEAEAIFFQDIEQIPENLLFCTAVNDILTVIHSINSSISKSEIKRKISENAVTVNGVKISENQTLSQGKYKIKIGAKMVFCIKII